MQCPQCGFHNIPGVAACVACRASLAGGVRGGTAVAVLTPPRAPAWRKALRRLTRPLDNWAARRRINPRVWAAPLLGIVPGLAQLARGQWRSGAAFAGAWLVLAASAVFFFGALPGVALLGLAVASHVVSALLPYAAAMATLPLSQRCWVSQLAFLALIATVYLPLYGLADRVAYPLQIRTNFAVELQAGDTVVVWRRDAAWRPRVGALVAYRGLWEQEAIDRVLGLPGDRIICKGGVLSRNGRRVPASGYPLAPGSLSVDLDLTVPPDHYFIWQSVNIRFLYERTVAQVAENAIRPRSALLGEVGSIAAPLERRRPLWSKSE